MHWFKKNLPDQVIADQDHLFGGFDGYKKVIESVNVVLIACASKFHPMYAEAAIRAGKHVFVEKPHGIDPVGVRRMQAAADLAKQKNLSLLSGLQSRFHNGYREASSGSTTGRSARSSPCRSCSSAARTRLVTRNPAYSETQYQFSNWYHFCWLSGDDVTQSLVHNMDRAAWILKEEMPSWCFGLGGRSASFGDAYGDMYDHHTVVYEYASGTRVYALCRTQNNCYGNSGDIIMGTQGPVRSGQLPHHRRDELAVSRVPHNNPYVDEQRALIESVRTGKPINSGSYMAGSTMSTVLGQLACYTGQPLKWDDVANSEFQFGPAPDVASFDTPPPSKPDTTGNYPMPKPGLYDDPLKAPKVPAEKAYQAFESIERRPRVHGRRSAGSRPATERIGRPIAIARASDLATRLNRIKTYQDQFMIAHSLPSPWPRASLRPRPKNKRRPPKTRVLIVSQRRSLARRQEDRSRRPGELGEGSADRCHASSRTPSFSPRRSMADYDVILLEFYNPEPLRHQAEAQKNLAQLVEQGKGLVVLHFSCGAFSTWPEYSDLAGRIWDRKNTHDPRGPFNVKIIDREHPITRGMDDFQADDELTCA